MTSTFTRMARGETRYDFVDKRKTWYIVSAVVIAICLVSLIFRGFNLGIDFAGGTEFQSPSPEGTTLSQAADAVESAGVAVVSQQETGIGYLIRTGETTQVEVRAVKESLSTELGVPISEISDASVSASWGEQATTKALQGLLVFLVAVCIYIAFRFEWRMAAAALVALLHDLVISAGIYSIVGFEVTPATAIGFLTILAYSLYDTVVVFDKVDENTKGILASSRATYGERANLAVNQVLMRSINTSIIALLPVAGLLFVGAGLLGAGTLKDLALVLLVGIAAGTYSSIFIATPVLVDIKRRQPEYAALDKRVAKRRGGTGAKAKTPVPVPSGAPALENEDSGEPAGDVDDAASGDGADEAPSTGDRSSSGGGSGSQVQGPKPGARPDRGKGGKHTGGHR